MERLYVALLLCTSIGLAAEPALTIYNQRFAVVRERIPVEWNAGASEVRYAGATAHVEPDSVILTGLPVQVLEQNYRNDPISQPRLLSLFEGQTIDFLVKGWADGQSVIKGKIIRSGYVPHSNAMRRYGNEYAMVQHAYSSPDAGGQPLVEVDGKLVFGLPGTPVFPSLGTGAILRPTLTWKVQAASPGKADADLSYITGGMSWQADYNIVGSENSDVVDVTGWVTMDNQTGTTFENARIQLMAGDITKLVQDRGYSEQLAMRASAGAAAQMPPVTERTFDEYHLYTLQNTTTLRDRETKQVEFVRASKVKARQIYVYEGARIDRNAYRGWNYDNIRNDPNYGVLSNPKVWVMREFENSRANQLGLPLPKGLVRFYKTESGGRSQFLGENQIDHTPTGELLRIYTGNAFDVVGERKRVDYRTDRSGRRAEENFEIKLRNRKQEPVEIRVVERLYRSANWRMMAESQNHTRIDSNTIEFRIAVPPNEERTLTYHVEYTW